MTKIKLLLLLTGKFIMKILIIQQKMIGDVLICSLLCENIIKWNPQAKIDFIANTHTLPVLNNNPHINKIIVFGDHFKNDKKSFYNFLNDQRKNKYDIVIDAYGKIESVLTSWLTPSPIKIGYKKWYTNWVYSISVERQLNKLKDDIQLSIKNRIKLLIPIIGKNFNYIYKPKIYLDDYEKENAKAVLINRRKSPLLMISALGSSKLKTYPIEKMSFVLDYIVSKYDAQLILNYMPNQREEILLLHNKIKLKTKQALLFKKSPGTLREYISIVSCCDAIIGNEGGAINIAKSLDIPSFAIFSPQINPEAWNTSSQTQIGVHVKNYNKNFKGFKLNSKQIICLYDSFEFDYFKDELSIFMNRLK